MKCTLSIVVILASVAYAHVLPLVSYVQPVPQYNTAIVQSEQVGGSFAYSVSEGQAFQEISPIISTAVHPVYAYQWTGAYPAPGPNVVLSYPLYGSVIPSVSFLPGAVPAPPPSGEEPSPDDDSTGIETVTDEADNQPDDAEPIKQTSSADDNANDDSVSVDSA